MVKQILGEGKDTEFKQFIREVKIWSNEGAASRKTNSSIIRHIIIKLNKMKLIDRTKFPILKDVKGKNDIKDINIFGKRTVQDIFDRVLDKQGRGGGGRGGGGPGISRKTKAQQIELLKKKILDSNYDDRTTALKSITSLAYGIKTKYKDKSELTTNERQQLTDLVDQKYPLKKVSNKEYTYRKHIPGDPESWYAGQGIDTRATKGIYDTRQWMKLKEEGLTDKQIQKEKISYFGSLNKPEIIGEIKSRAFVSQPRVSSIWGKNLLKKGYTSEQSPKKWRHEIVMEQHPFDKPILTAEKHKVTMARQQSLVNTKFFPATKAPLPQISPRFPSPRLSPPYTPKVEALTTFSPTWKPGQRFPSTLAQRFLFPISSKSYQTVHGIDWGIDEEGEEYKIDEEGNKVYPLEAGAGSPPAHPPAPGSPPPPLIQKSRDIGQAERITQQIIDETLIELFFEFVFESLGEYDKSNPVHVEIWDSMKEDLLEHATEGIEKWRKKKMMERYYLAKTAKEIDEYIEKRYTSKFHWWEKGKALSENSARLELEKILREDERKKKGNPKQYRMWWPGYPIDISNYKPIFKHKNAPKIAEHQIVVQQYIKRYRASKFIGNPVGFAQYISQKLLKKANIPKKLKAKLELLFREWLRRRREDREDDPGAGTAIASGSRATGANAGWDMRDPQIQMGDPPIIGTEQPTREMLSETVQIGKFESEGIPIQPEREFKIPKPEKEKPEKEKSEKGGGGSGPGGGGEVTVLDPKETEPTGTVSGGGIVKGKGGKSGIGGTGHMIPEGATTIKPTPHVDYSELEALIKKSKQSITEYESFKDVPVLEALASAEETTTRIRSELSLEDLRHEASPAITKRIEAKQLMEEADDWARRNEERMRKRHKFEKSQKDFRKKQREMNRRRTQHEIDMITPRSEKIPILTRSMFKARTPRTPISRKSRVTFQFPTPRTP